MLLQDMHLRETQDNRYCIVTHAYILSCPIVVDIWINGTVQFKTYAYTGVCKVNEM